MAIIFSTTTDIDVTKLKKELEYLTSSGPFVTKVLRVLEIIPGNPASAHPDDKTTITLLNALGQEPTESQLAVAQTIADSHLGRNDQKENLKFTAHDTIVLKTEAQGSLLIENVDAISIGVADITTTVLPKINSTVDVGSPTLPINTIVAKNLVVQEGIQSPDLDNVDLALTNLNNRVVILEDDPTTKTYVDTSIGNLIGGAPDLLNTLKELADALGSDPNFATTILNQISTISGSVTTLTTRVENLEDSLENLPPPVVSLSGLTDVAITTPTAEQVLKYNGASWVNAEAPDTGASILDELSDVAITTPSKGQFIVYNGIQFVNSKIIDYPSDQTGLVLKPGPSPTGQGEFPFTVQNSLGSSRFFVKVSDTSSENYVIIADKLGIGSSDRPATPLNVHGGVLQLTTGTESPSYENGFRLFYNGTNIIQKICPASGSIIFYTGGGNQNRVNINPTGLLTANNGVAINSGEAATKGLIIKGAASQTANLLEVQNASGSILSTILADGTVHSKRFTETSANAFTTSLEPSAGVLSIDTAVGNSVLGALNASVTTWAFINVPTENNKITTISVIISGNSTYTYGSACSINGVAVIEGVEWFGGLEPVATNSTDILTFSIIKDSTGSIKVIGSAQSVDINLDDGLDGGGTTNYLTKWQSSSIVTNSAVYENNGNVGIGITSPTGILHVLGSGTGGTTANIVQTATSLSSGSYTLEVDNSSQTSNVTTSGAFKVESSSGRAFVVDGLGRTVVTGGTGDATAEAFPGLRAGDLTVKNTGTYAVMQVISRIANGDGAYISLAKTRGAGAGNFTAVAPGDLLGDIRFWGATGTEFRPAAAIRGVCEASSVSATNMAGRIEFHTTPDASVNTTERMRISRSGQVGIGTAGSTAYQLHLSSDSAAKPSTNTWTIASDERIKTNIQPYNKGLPEILQVNPVTYDYNGKGGMQAGPGGVSIIAQELQPVFPECVGTFQGKLNEGDEETTELLNYNGHAITFALINAIKELSSKLNTLQAEKKALEAAKNDLEQRVLALEQNNS